MRDEASELTFAALHTEPRQRVQEDQGILVRSHSPTSASFAPLIDFVLRPSQNNSSALHRSSIEPITLLDTLLHRNSLPPIRALLSIIESCGATWPELVSRRSLFAHSLALLSVFRIHTNLFDTPVPSSCFVFCFRIHGDQYKNNMLCSRFTTRRRR